MSLIGATAASAVTYQSGYITYAGYGTTGGYVTASSNRMSKPSGPYFELRTWPQYASYFATAVPSYDTYGESNVPSSYRPSIHRCSHLDSSYGYVNVNCWYIAA